MTSWSFGAASRVVFNVVSAHRFLAMSTSVDHLYSVKPLFGNESFLIVQPKQGSNVADASALVSEMIPALLRRAAGILLRGFRIFDDEQFSTFVREIDPNLLHYEYASTPRSHVGGQLYTSTEYPPHQTIVLHNEMAYCKKWPSTLWFYCHTPATSGGETTVADSHAVFKGIDPEVREAFVRRGVQYVRNYNTGLDLTWQKAFSTENRAEVEAYCKDYEIEFEWRHDGVLQTRQICDAVIEHKVSGKPVWFNQAHLFHISGLAEDLYQVLRDNVPRDELPRNAYFGDGTEIPIEMLKHIRDVYQQQSRGVNWQRGDVLVVDNVLAAHGRSPFQGERRIIVAMA